MCAISTVANPNDSLRPISLPKNIKRSINEIPVTISAFIIGICVTDITTFFDILLRIAVTPTAAAVPKTVDITADRTATIRVCSRAVSIVVSLASPSYQRVEKPPITQTLEDELKEKTIITATGA